MTRRTPILRIATAPGEPRLSLKLECLQESGSFKFRGALNRILLDSREHSQVVAASGGNHGAAVAHACRALGLSATIFVPSSAPAPKIRLIESVGAEVQVVPGTFTNAHRAALDFTSDHDALFVHPFDDPAVIVGQATLGKEILEQCPDVTAVAVAVGGGGLAAGVTLGLEGRASVLTVEPTQCPTLATALAKAAPSPVEVGGVAADSLGAPLLGERAFQLLSPTQERVILIDEDDILDAQVRLWTDLRIAAEPAAACCYAGAQTALGSMGADDHLVAVICGANLDMVALAELVTRGSG